MLLDCILNHTDFEMESQVEYMNKIYSFIISGCHCEKCLLFKKKYNAIQKIIVFLKKQIHKHKLSGHFDSTLYINEDLLDFYTRKILLDKIFSC